MTVADVAGMWGIIAIPVVTYLVYELVRLRRAYRLCKDHNAALQQPQDTQQQYNAPKKHFRVLRCVLANDTVYNLYEGPSGACARRAFEAAGIDPNTVVEFWDGDVCRGSF